MEHRWQYPSVSQKIQGQPYLFLRHFRGCSYGVMQNTTHASGAYVNWREKGALQPAFPGKESSPVPITVGAPVEKTRLFLHDLVRSAIITTAVAPIERVKLLLQCQNMIINSGRLSHPYKGILDCFSTIIRNEGFFALWRSNLANLTTHFRMVLNLGFSISLGYENAKFVDISSALLLTAKYAFAGAASGLFFYPLNYAETRLANDVKTTSGTRQFNGIVDVYRKTLISDGIGGLYRGFSLSLVRVTLFPTIQALTFHALKPWFLGYQSNLMPAVWIQAFAALSFTTMALYPTGGGAEIIKLTVSTGLLLAIFLPVWRRVAAEKKRTSESGRPAHTTVNLKWSNLRDGSHDSDK
ncbi:hypothetical protein SLEP1_g13571 [Rubroshorea leprosula]|uniref:ADP/ATP translocase n=1 Tax=Rubroshorea leprosula TaxID=152421 RepID=A0AAV5IPD9_9ROSI|nr:hypothetical protein SLEP1_g13571 [Rubroshorea leprosula]